MFCRIREDTSSVARTREASPISFQSILPVKQLMSLSANVLLIVQIWLSFLRFVVSGVTQTQSLYLNPWTSPAGSHLVLWRQFPVLWAGYQQREHLSGWRVPFADRSF